MLTDVELLDLYRQLRERDVLSVYLDAEERDPAEKTAWRRRLNNLVAEARGAADGAAGRRAAFDAAVARVMERLDQYTGFLPGRGWAAFATPDRLWYAGSLPAPMPDLVAWDTGMRVAPLVRGLKQNRAVIALLLDRQRARLFRYRGGELGEPEELVPDAPEPDIEGTRGAKRAATHTGMRGATGTDVRQSLADAAAERLARLAVERAVALAGDDGFLVLGGTPEMIAAAARRLPKTMAGRVAERPSLHLAVTPAELQPILEEAASTLSRKQQEELLRDVLEAARAGGLGAIGREHVEYALRDGGVDTLLISRRLRESQPEVVERIIRAALDAGVTRVEELGGEGADALDGEAGGVAARLRYRPRPAETVGAK
ncbi:MAG: hypothetical protein DIU52_010200 [bacterium]|jgi:hypothetical protein|nr:MAG: hypothetical protein DIU52_10795 [bacterium]